MTIWAYLVKESGFLVALVMLVASAAACFWWHKTNIRMTMWCGMGNSLTWAVAATALYHQNRTIDEAYAYILVGVIAVTLVAVMMTDWERLAFPRLDKAIVATLLGMLLSLVFNFKQYSDEGSATWHWMLEASLAIAAFCATMTAIYGFQVIESTFHSKEAE